MSRPSAKLIMVLGLTVGGVSAAWLTHQRRAGPSGDSSGVSFADQFQRSAQGLPGDYLAPALRGEVEQLKLDVQRQSSDLSNGVARAQLLWRWANAYALRGGLLPVELPAIVALVVAQQEPPETTKRRLRYMDLYIKELALREERPTAIGTLTTDATQPFLPGSYQTISQTYHFGDMPMVPGGGFWVAKHFMSNHGALQTDDPQLDNYVTIRSSNPEATFVRDSIKVGGMHGGFRTENDGLVFRLEGATLTKRDTVTITYGDRSGGSRGFKVQTYSNDGFPLPIYVDLQGNSHFLTLPIQPYQVVGGPVHAVHGFAPSVVKVGEPFDVSVRSEDLYYNRATGDIPAYQVRVNGEPFTEIAAGDEGISLLNNMQFDKPGVYRCDFRSPDGKIVGSSNPIWVRENPQLRIYWGDTHGHCGFAEGQGTPDSFFQFGRDDARLDFLTHSEHDLWMDDAEWETLIRNVDKYHEEGKFITILGYEWTVGTKYGGHHNVFFRTPQNRRRVPRQSAPVLTDLYKRLAAENDMDDVLIIPHAHQAGEWRMSHPQMETLVEIMSMHGHFEWFGLMYLNHGHEVGFVAASDDHLSHPGYPSPQGGGLAAQGGLAAVLAPEKTRDAIFDGMKNLAAYATTGQRIILDVDLNGARMGSRIADSPQRELRGQVFGTAPIDNVTVIKNGQEVWSQDYLTVKTEPPGDAARQQRFELSFFSSTNPHMRDNPRGWRLWHGTLRVSGATLVGVQSPALENRLLESINWNEAKTSGQVNFKLRTRGGTKNIVLQLKDIQGDAKIDVELLRSRERTTGPSLYRRPALLPATNVSFSLNELEQGRAVSELPIDQFVDRMKFRRIHGQPKLDQTFAFTDSESTRPGDYYFVRVQQLDGGQAWSSPIWVGGFSTRY